MAHRPPKHLRERGKALWKRLDVEANTPEGVLAEEACRVADKIDDLYTLLDGRAEEAILREATYKLEDYFPDHEGNVHLEVKLTGLQNEMRQQQALLRQLILSAVGTKRYIEKGIESEEPEEPEAAVKAGKPPKGAVNGSVVSEFGARRQQREAS